MCHYSHKLNDFMLNFVKFSRNSFERLSSKILWSKTKRQQYSECNLTNLNFCFDFPRLSIYLIQIEWQRVTPPVLYCLSLCLDHSIFSSPFNTNFVDRVWSVWNCLAAFLLMLINDSLDNNFELLNFQTINNFKLENRTPTAISVLQNTSFLALKMISFPSMLKLNQFIE